MTYGEYVLLFLLFLMMLSDLYSDRIPNGMIPLEIAAGLFCSFRQQGLWGVLYALLSMTAAFLLTYFLFKLGALGAGDIWYEAPEEEKNIITLLEMINASETREDDENFKNAVDLMFEELAEKAPDHFAVKQYRKYKLAAGVIR